VNFQEVEELKSLVQTLDQFNYELPASVQQSLTGTDGLRRLAAAMTIMLTDNGGTFASATGHLVRNVAFHMCVPFGTYRVNAVCDEIQCSEIPAQSAAFQEMFGTFNNRYFSGRLPDYKILVVYDVRYWAIERCGYPRGVPFSAEASSFVDLPARQIFIRYLAHYTRGQRMEEALIRQMAHAATDGDHGDAWKAEMKRVTELGAPVSSTDLDS
jgi:hypothetical protein